jgi:REP element-mobilizing transposase RayT
MRSAQRAFEWKTRGGKRKGAGRKPNGATAGVPHRPRRFLSARHPLHVTLRVVRGLPGLRRRHIWKAVQWALTITVRRPDFRICHVSIQGNHIHLIVEADDARALARGMQGFQISCAKQINARVVVAGERRRGRVFADRFHARPLDKPMMVRNALAYVLNNWRHHRGPFDQPRARLDPFSTAAQFPGWIDDPPDTFVTGELLPVAYPTTWLLTTGWKRRGLISPWDRPGPRE